MSTPTLMLEESNAELGGNTTSSHEVKDGDLNPSPRAMNVTVPHDLESRIQQLLPVELKLAVLKEQLRMWATNIPRGPFFSGEPHPSHTFRHFDPTVVIGDKAPEWMIDNFQQTSRAMLVDRSARPCRLGWCVLPLYRDECSPEFCDWDLALRRPWFLEHLSQRPISSIGHPIQVAKILEPARWSKDFYPPLEKFFFGHITWEFCCQSQFSNLLEKHALSWNGQPPGAAFRATRLKDNNFNSPLPRRVLGYMRNLCLRIEEWEDFIGLFEYVVEVLSSPSNPFLKLVGLEIRGHHLFDAKVLRDHPVYEIRVHDPKIRMRYLVTRCHQLVKLLPDLTIVLTGFSENTATKLNPAVYPPVNQHRIRDMGFGYSYEEETQFINTKEDLHGPRLLVPRPEIEESESQRYQNRWKKSEHWKILFVEEWVKAWELGLKDPANDEEDGKEYYDAVYISLDTREMSWKRIDDDGYESDDEYSTYEYEYDI